MVFLIYMNKFTFHYFHCQVLEILNLYWALLFIHAHETDLSWAPNTKALCRKAFSRLWIIRRLKRLNVSQADLLDVYEKQIRCICEYACPVCLLTCQSLPLLWLPEAWNGLEWLLYSLGQRLSPSPPIAYLTDLLINHWYCIVSNVVIQGL